MNRKIVDHEGKPLDEATLARIFRPMSPELFDDPVCGAALRRLAAEDPEVIEAVAEVDRTLIWGHLQGVGMSDFARGAEQIDRVCFAIAQMETLRGYHRVA
jgi:hypothetical protein